MIIKISNPRRYGIVIAWPWTGLWEDGKCRTKLVWPRWVRTNDPPTFDNHRVALAFGGTFAIVFDITWYVNWHGGKL
jgi:hypothetical protein